MQFSLSKDKKHGQLFARTTFAASTNDAGQRVLEGLAIVYGPLSDDRGGYRVRISPGAVKFTSYVLALLNHNSDLVIGNTANNTLGLADQSDGIHVRIILPNNVDGDKAWTWAADRYATGMSFGCIINEATETMEDGVTVCTVTDLTCDEVTITPWPSFTDTYIGASDDSEPATDEPADVESPAEDAGEDDASIAAAAAKLMRMRIDAMKLCA